MATLVSRVTLPVYAARDLRGGSNGALLDTFATNRLAIAFIYPLAHILIGGEILETLTLTKLVWLAHVAKKAVLALLSVVAWVTNYNDRSSPFNFAVNYTSMIAFV